MIPYREAWDYQEELHRDLLDKKRSGQLSFPGHLIFCEHPPVFTLGKSGLRKNLLIDDNLLEQKGIEFFNTNRGGDMTFHGPGQIVGYPILDLEQLGLGIKSYIELLELSVIKLLDHYGIRADRFKEATGVWLDVDKPGLARKICAVGVKASRYITMHGFAFNINTDLSYYNYINPCGITDKGVTSMEKELGRKLDMKEIKVVLRKVLEGTLRVSEK
jgi:lipoyl(octanoyl) transferase